MRRANSRTSDDVALAAAIDPAALSAAFASSSNAKIFASVQVPAAGAPADIADVSPVTVVEAAIHFFGKFEGKKRTNRAVYSTVLRASSCADVLSRLNTLASVKRENAL